MPPVVQVLLGVAAALATIGAAWLALVGNRPKVQADAMGAAVDAGLRSLNAALERANHDVESLQEDLDAARQMVAELTREVAVLRIETDSLQRQLGARDLELAQLRRATT